MHFDELQGSYGGHEGVALVLTPRVGEDRRKCLHAVRNAKDLIYRSGGALISLVFIYSPLQEAAQTAPVK